MTTFGYQALHRDGSVAKGQIEAATRQEALRLLTGQGMQPVALASAPAVSASAVTPLWFARKNRVSAKGVENLTRQLASLLTAGVPLAKALHLLAEESGAGALRQCCQRLHDDVVDGFSLAQSMSNQPAVFADIYCAMVRAGESGGFLEVVLRQIAEFQNRHRELRSKVYGAMVYPAVLALLCVAVLIFLLLFFIPRFQLIFADFGVALPPLTNLIVHSGLLLKKYGIFLVAIGVAVVLALREYFASAAGQRQKQRILLQLPLSGAVAAQYAMTRFCAMLGTLTQVGVPLINALRVAREAIGNQVLSDAVDEAVHRVQHGDRLGNSLASCPLLFSRSTIAMVTVAEQSGRLAEELLRLAVEAEQDLDRRLRFAVALAEPALLFVMAAIVGLIVIGMVLPIFAIQDYIQ